MGNIWLDFGFLHHHKIKKLKRLLGAEAVLCLIELWSYAAQYRESGELYDMDIYDIEDVSNWSGEGGVFVQQLIDIKLLDFKHKTYIINNFLKNNPFIMKRKERSKAAQKAAQSRWDKEKEIQVQCKGNADAIQTLDIPNANETKRNETKQKNKDFVEQARRNGNIPYKEIIDDLNVKSGKMFKHTSKHNKGLIKARWNEGYRLDDFKKVHDNIINNWQYDPKMVEFIRPSTIYSPKFEGYLNMKSNKQDKPNPFLG
jgi:uncharacterized phage protein (TIGR02220 family)